MMTIDKVQQYRMTDTVSRYIQVSSPSSRIHRIGPESYFPVNLSINVAAPILALSTKLSTSGLTDITLAPTTCNPFFVKYAATSIPILSARFSVVFESEGAAVRCEAGKSVACGAEEGDS